MITMDIMSFMKVWVALLAWSLCAQTFPASSLIDEAVEQSIKGGEIPGAVVLIGHEGRILHRKAYGNRALVPSIEPMTIDTIFDCASLTKVVATTASLMKLFEQGKFRLNDRVTTYLQGFQGGRSDITIRNLLTHFSGLRPDLTLHPPWSGYETGVRLALMDKPVALPGARFIYSDINFILLGELVHRLSGQLLSDYARAQIFLPLGMKETFFLPPAALVGRIAPTERSNGAGMGLRGTVHDTTARYMGGVAGHAGLFSTAEDLARFCQMMLNGGSLEGARLFSTLTIRKFTTPQSPPDQPILRGLGWDIDSPYSAERGDLFPIGSYGHTGFTGTSLWIDPVSQTYIILLTNSLHPFPRPAIVALRGKIGTIAAAALGREVPGIQLTGYNETLAGAGIHRQVARNGDVRTGLDMMEESGFRALKAKRVGLITNHTGLDRLGRRNVDQMVAAGIRVAALFSPEHGFTGSLDRPEIEDTRDAATGIRVWSLYGKTTRPTPAMLQGLDALVFDIQDIGARFYTYVSTMAYGMEAATKAGIPYYVLDRPNPLTGVHVEGPMLDRDKLSFVGYYPLPLRHGMTIGELARMFNSELKLGANLTVVPMQGWERGDWFDSTNLPWIDPSPNIRSLSAALLYPGLAMLEYDRNYSVGRGTDAPFEQIGAPFINAREFAAYLNKRLIPGVRVYPTRFRPAASNLAGTLVEGVRFVVTDRQSFDSGRLGIEIAAALAALYPGKISLAANAKLIGSDAVITAIEAREDPNALIARLQDTVAAFLPVREKYLLYR